LPIFALILYEYLSRRKAEVKNGDKKELETDEKKSVSCISPPY